jgi:hypothetical protein
VWPDGCIGGVTTWTPDELDRIGGADELEITTTRSDGSLRRWVPIWVVRVGDDLYVRSYRGADGAWYRQATQHAQGRIRAGGLERDVTVDRPDDTVQPAIDDAYRAKYARYGAAYLQPMLAARATATTLRLTLRT